MNMSTSNSTPVAASVNTTDLAKQLAQSPIGKELGLSKDKAVDVYHTIVEHLTEHLAAGALVRVHGLGNFHVSDTAERQGKNPLTKEEMTIAAGKRVRLSVSDRIKEAVKTGKVPPRPQRGSADKDDVSPDSNTAPGSKPPAAQAEKKAGGRKAGKNPAVAAPAAPPAEIKPQGGFRPPRPPAAAAPVAAPVAAADAAPVEPDAATPNPDDV